MIRGLIKHMAEFLLVFINMIPVDGWMKLTYLIYVLMQVGYVLCSNCKVFKCVTFPNYSDSENLLSWTELVIRLNQTTEEIFGYNGLKSWLWLSPRAGYQVSSFSSAQKFLLEKNLLRRNYVEDIESYNVVNWHVLILFGVNELPIKWICLFLLLYIFWQECCFPILFSISFRKIDIGALTFFFFLVVQSL